MSLRCDSQKVKLEKSPGPPEYDSKRIICQLKPQNEIGGGGCYWVEKEDQCPCNSDSLEYDPEIDPEKI